MDDRFAHAAALAGDHPGVDDRIREGLALAITDRGYAATTIADIARSAGLPVNVVYERFGDKEACYLAFYRDATTLLLEHIDDVDRQHAAAGMDWRSRVREGARAYLAALSAAPAVTQVALLEIFAAGSLGRQVRRGVMDRYAAALEHLAAEGARQGLDVRPLGPHDALAIAGAVHELVVHHIETVGAERLVELATPVGDVIVRMIEAR